MGPCWHLRAAAAEAAREVALGKRSGGMSSDRARRSPGACCAAARRMGQLRGRARQAAAAAAGRRPSARAAVPGTGTLLKGTCPQGQWVYTGCSVDDGTERGPGVASMGACEAGAAHVMHVHLVRHDWDLYRNWDGAG